MLAPFASPPSSASPCAPIARRTHVTDGSLRASGFELDGAVHGHWEWFRQDGSLMRSGEFDLGHQVGTWRTWDRTGQLVAETCYGPAAE